MSPTALTEKLIPLHAAGDEESMAEVAQLTREAEKAAKPKSRAKPKTSSKSTARRK